MEKVGVMPYSPQSFDFEGEVESEDAVIFKFNCGPICHENIQIGACAPQIDLQTLDALNSMEQVQQYMVKVAQVHTVGSQTYIKYELINLKYASLQSFIEDCQKKPLSESQLKTFTR